MIKAFTPGKAIISGEYSVIFGETAVVCSIDWGVTAEILPGKTSSELQKDKYFRRIIEIFEIYCRGYGYFSESNRWLVVGADSSKKIDLQNINMKCSTGIYNLKGTNTPEGTNCPLGIKISSNLPRNSGLGSSAAFAASILKVLFLFYEIEVSQKELIDLVWQAENFIHGKSSGLDPVAVVVGGLVEFKRVVADEADGGGSDNSSKVSFIYKQILPDFDFKKHFTLINSGKSQETTGEMVGQVLHRLKMGEVSMDVIKKQGEVSRRVISKLKRGESVVGETRKNHELLMELGVVGDRAQKVVSEIISNVDVRIDGSEVESSNSVKFDNIKQVAAKITGAGGVKEGSGFILSTHL